MNTSHVSPRKRAENLTLKGIAASDGIKIGQALVVLKEDLNIPFYQIREEEKASEIKRLRQALHHAKQQIIQIQKQIERQLGTQEAMIFEAHLMVLQDEALLQETTNTIEKESCNAEYAFQKATEYFVEAFYKLEDNYLKERARDLEDVGARVLKNLLGQAQKTLPELLPHRITVAEDFSPSETSRFKQTLALGIATDKGSNTSHAVIIARALGIPAVVGLKKATKLITNQDQLILDGHQGLLIINPNEAQLAHYRQLEKAHLSHERKLMKTASLAALSLDGIPIHAHANINGPEECKLAKRCGAEGVGLYRTEILFISGSSISEEEQYESYLKVAEAFQPHPVIVRTFDMGGDKEMWVQPSQGKDGLRGIRLCLKYPHIFKTQLRAILRANKTGNLKLMFPMITRLEELFQAKQILAQAQKELKIEMPIEVGAMVETPSAALTVDLLAEHCQFLSVGTNDLVQYLMGTDRTQDNTNELSSPSHPSLLRLLREIFKAAGKHKLEIQVCGEMAGEPLYLPILIGMGARTLSTAAPLLPSIKAFIRKLTVSSTQELVVDLLKRKEQKDILRTLEDFLKKHQTG